MTNSLNRSLPKLFTAAFATVAILATAMIGLGPAHALEIKQIKLKAAPGSLINGTSAPSARVQVFNEADPLGSTIANMNGQWQVYLGQTLTPGTYRLRVTARDPLKGGLATATSGLYDLKPNGIALLRENEEEKAKEQTAKKADTRPTGSFQQRLEKRADELGLLASERFDKFVSRLRGPRGRQLAEKKQGDKTNTGKLATASRVPAPEGEPTGTEPKSATATPSDTTDKPDDKDTASAGTGDGKPADEPAKAEAETSKGVASNKTDATAGTTKSAAADGATNAPVKKPEPSKPTGFVDNTKKAADDLWNTLTNIGDGSKSTDKKAADGKPVKPADKTETADTNAAETKTAQKTAEKTAEKSTDSATTSTASSQSDSQSNTRSAAQTESKPAAETATKSATAKTDKPAETKAADGETPSRVTGLIDDARRRLQKLLGTDETKTAEVDTTKSTDNAEQAKSPAKTTEKTGDQPEKPTELAAKSDTKTSEQKQNETQNGNLTPSTSSQTSDAAPQGSAPKDGASTAANTKPKPKATDKAPTKPAETRVAKAEPPASAKPETPVLPKARRKPAKTARIPARLRNARLRVRDIAYEIAESGRGTLTASGKGRPGARVALAIDGATVTSRRIANNGRWRLRFKRTLAGGTSRLQVIMRDRQTGNVQRRRFQIDNPTRSQRRSVRRTRPSRSTRRSRSAATTVDTYQQQVRQRYIRTPSAPRFNQSFGVDAGPQITVRPGDTLQSIAGRVYGDPGLWREILRANPDRIRNPNQIYAGQRLRVN